MDNCNCEKKNHIHCSVKQCRFNMAHDCCCSLDEVSIGTHDRNPSDSQCVDCNSFQSRNNCGCC